MSRNNIIFFVKPAIQLWHYVIPAYGLSATTMTTVKLLDARRSTWKEWQRKQGFCSMCEVRRPMLGLLGGWEGNLHYTMWLLSKSTGCRLRGPPHSLPVHLSFLQHPPHQCYFTNFLFVAKMVIIHRNVLPNLAIYKIMKYKSLIILLCFWLQTED